MALLVVNNGEDAIRHQKHAPNTTTSGACNLFLSEVSTRIIGQYTDEVSDSGEDHSDEVEDV